MNINKTILIVDDSEFDRSLLVKALARKSNYKIMEASSGEQCHKLLETEKIDLILLDIMMPDTFGTLVLKTIRESFNPIELPIIMITAKTDAIDVVGSLHLGANDYITKPVNFDIAISRINTHLRLSEISREMAKLREIAALHAMISTYNHEINNPLSVAIGCIKKLETQSNDTTTLKKIETSLWRIADIVKKIREVSEKHDIQYAPYAGSGKMIKIK